MSRTVCLLPTGGANLASLADGFERAGARLTDSFADADRLVLPGVGAAPEAMRRLRAAGLVERLRAERRPVLGVCLGMQLLFAASAEGPTEALAVLDGEVARLDVSPGRPVPHTGWCRVRRARGRPSALLGDDDGSWFYFTHSYAARPQRDTVALAFRSGDAPGPQGFAAVVERPPFYGAQFHPERSGAAGVRLLARFLEVPPCG